MAERFVAERFVEFHFVEFRFVADRSSAADSIGDKSAESCPCDTASVSRELDFGFLADIADTLATSYLDTLADIAEMFADYLDKWLSLIHI